MGSAYTSIYGEPRRLKECFIGVGGMPRPVKEVWGTDPSGQAKLFFSKPTSNTAKYQYVSLGDSIAAGHSINGSWASNYGVGSQFGENGNTATTLVPNCYTDLINKHLVSLYGSSNVTLKSFAHSGDKVEDLIQKLNNSNVINSVKTASLVTVCIGANTVLGPALNKIEQYIKTGNPTLNALEGEIGPALNVLRDNSNANSMFGLFNKLESINPNAKYIFTTIYNPYRYLHLDEGNNGFFGPILNTIPSMRISIEDWMGFDIPFVDLSFDLADLIKSGLLNTSAVRTLFTRVNALGGTSGWVEGQVNNLNSVLKGKVVEYDKENFTIIETKAKFDTYPATGNPGYNDLVNVEYVPGYNTATMNWSALFNGASAYDYWWNLAYSNLSFVDARWSTNPMDYINFNIENFAYQLVIDMVERVIIPDIDPHPEEAGQRLLSELFIEGIPAR